MMATLSTSFRVSSLVRDYPHSKRQLRKKPLTCVVCGSVARGFNFGAITCMSCKIFFRRNAFTDLNELHCQTQGHCEINQQTRKCCTYCRLVTCFRVGMKRQLFRTKENNYFKSARSTSQPYSTKLAFPANFEIGTASNFSLSEANVPAHEIHQQLDSVGNKPLKVRAKGMYIYDMMSTFAECALKFLKTFPEFAALPNSNKQMLIMRNARVIIMFYSQYQMGLKPIKCLTQTPYWETSWDCILPPPIKFLHNETINTIENISMSDSHLVQLIFGLMAFSTNSMSNNESWLDYQFNEYYHSLLLYKVQNIYVELIWKYLIFRFGEVHTIRHYCTIVKTILKTEVVTFVMDKTMISLAQMFHENILESIKKLV